MAREQTVLLWGELDQSPCNSQTAIRAHDGLPDPATASSLRPGTLQPCPQPQQDASLYSTSSVLIQGLCGVTLPSAVRQRSLNVLRSPPNCNSRGFPRTWHTRE